MAKWQARFFNKSLRWEIALTLILKIILLFFMKNWLLPPKLNDTQTKEGITERFVNLKIIPAMPLQKNPPSLPKKEP